MQVPWKVQVYSIEVKTFFSSHCTDISTVNCAREANLPGFIEL
jgi:hypothetical protein